MDTQDRLAEDRERWEAERLERELRDAQRIRSIRKSHAITGGITLLIFLFLLDMLFQGVASIFHPLNLILNFLAAAVFGLPTGYLISVRGGGVWRGAITAAGVFLVVGIILGLPTLFTGRTFGNILGSAVVLAFLGLFPGAIIGMHVDADS